MVASFVMGATMLIFGAADPAANIYDFDIVNLWWTVVYAVIIRTCTEKSHNAQTPQD